MWPDRLNSAPLLLTLLIFLLAACPGGGDGGTSGGGTTPSSAPPSASTAAPVITALGALPGVNGLRAHQNQLFWFDNNPFAHFKSWNTGGGPINTLAMRMGRPLKLALSGQDVYWTENPPNGVIPSGMQIKKVSPDETVTLLSTSQPSCAFGSTDDLIVDGSSIYYVAATACSAALVSNIVKLPLNGDPSTTMATTNGTIYSLVADSNHLYWLESDIHTGIYQIKGIAKTGGSPQTLFSDTSNNIGASIAIGNGYVLYTEITNSQGAYRIRRVPITGGASTILVEQSGGPVQSLAADNTNVYWADQTSIQSMQISGGTSSVLMNGPGGFMVMSILGNTLYWMETLCCTVPRSSTIKSVSTSGGTINVVQSAQGVIGGSLIIGNGNLYWTEGGLTVPDPAYGRIAKSSLAGGSVQTVASGIASISPRILIADQFIFIADGDSAVKKLPITGGFPEFLSPLYTASFVSLTFNGFATDGSFIYVKNPYIGHFAAIPIDGSAPSELPGDLTVGDAGGLTLINGRLYWLEDPSTIKSLPKTGGAVTTLFSSQGLFDFIADQTSIFFIQGGPVFSTINKMPLTGGQPSLLVPGAAVSSSNDMTQDGQSVYWSNQTTVGKASKSTGALSYYELIVKNSGGGIAVDDTSAYWIRDDILFRATPK